MGVYKRPLRPDELAHAGKLKKMADAWTQMREENAKHKASVSDKTRHGLTSQIEDCNRQIAEFKEIIANPNPRQKGYLDDYRAELQRLYTKKEKLHSQLQNYIRTGVLQH